MITKPMLAGKVDDLSKVDNRYPLYVTPKLDGIRCLKVNGKAVTRKFKPVPNKHIREQIEKYCPDGFDGEIMSGNKTFNELQSLVMSEEGTPEFEYFVFDYVKDDLDKAYVSRMNDLKDYQDNHVIPFVKAILPEDIYSQKDLLAKHEEYVKQGYEGLMMRRGLGPYKCGRSTVNEAFLLKLKSFDDSEAKIIDFEPFYHNANEAEKDELGHTKRSRKKAGLIAMDKLGAFKCQDIKSNIVFEVASGMTDLDRTNFWVQKDQLKGKILKYKYQGVGPNKKPRFPVFLGFRDERDIS